MHNSHVLQYWVYQLNSGEELWKRTGYLESFLLVADALMLSQLHKSCRSQQGRGWSGGWGDISVAEPIRKLLEVPCLLEWSKEIIMMGDFNNVINLALDTSTPKLSVRLPKVSLDWMEKNRCLEAWRKFHQKRKDFILFSGRHNSFSRIDYIIIPDGWMENVKRVDIKPRIYSNHAVVVLVWQRRREPLSGIWK